MNFPLTQRDSGSALVAGVRCLQLVVYDSMLFMTGKVERLCSPVVGMHVLTVRHVTSLVKDAGTDSAPPVPDHMPSVF